MTFADEEINISFLSSILQGKYLYQFPKNMQLAYYDVHDKNWV